MAQRTKLKALTSRLRDLEVESIGLSAIDLPTERSEARNLYQKRLEQLENAHSHSWFGDHSASYFNDFQSPPPGHSFDVEWGFIPGFNGPRNRGWRVYSRDEIRDFVFNEIGEGIFFELSELADRLLTDFSVLHDQVLDVMEALAGQVNANSLTRYQGKIAKELKPFAIADYINARIKSAPRMTRDSEEIAKGQIVPAHVQYQSSITSLETNKRRLHDLGGVLRNVIEAVSLYSPSEKIVGGASKIFIGHGRSAQWRILKDFIRDRLSLEHEEFNRVSSAGIGTKERLDEMLQECGFAFLVLAAEDLHGDGALHARENVIHEAGLFQGRLGWRKAIIVIEENCTEFSNIAGLGQIRFKRDNIATCFEEIRLVLEREGLLEP